MGKDGKLLGDVWKPLAHNGRKGLWRRGNDGGQTEDHAAKLEVVLHLRKGLEDRLENRDCLVELLVQDMEKGVAGAMVATTPRKSRSKLVVLCPWKVNKISLSFKLIYENLAE
jgi:hypothetical protein